MPIPYLIIDGYNLMHAAGYARPSYAPGNLEQCRARLLAELKERLSGKVLARTTIVFDAFDAPSNDSRTMERHSMSIVFAPQGTDADSEIERMLKHHSTPKRVVVVSSDRRLHKAARRRRAGFVGSEEFWTSIEIPPGTSAAPAVPSATEHPADDVGRWMEEFGDATLPEDSPPESSSFDQEYVKQIEQDLKRGRLK